MGICLINTLFLSESAFKNVFNEFLYIAEL